VDNREIAEQIRKKTNEIIDGLERKDFPNSAINWGDFICVEVSRKTVYYPQQDEEWIVVLEEGDPINYEVREHIGNKLAEHFKFPIYVYIEW
jgi:hypothetical protein